MATAASVDEYLATVPEGPRAVLEQIRALVRALAPDATETISYQMPAFRAHGRLLVSYAAFRDHVSFFPMSGSVLDAHRDEAKPYVGGKGTLHFAPGEPLPYRLVEAIVRERLAENAARSRRQG